MKKISFCLTPTNFPDFIRVVYDTLSTVVTSPAYRSTHTSAWKALVTTGVTDITDLDETLNYFNIEKDEVNSTENISNVINELKSRLPALGMLLHVGTITRSNKLNVQIRTDVVTGTEPTDTHGEKDVEHDVTPLPMPEDTIAVQDESEEGFNVPNKKHTFKPKSDEETPKPAKTSNSFTVLAEDDEAEEPHQPTSNQPHPNSDDKKPKKLDTLFELTQPSDEILANPPIHSMEDTIRNAQDNEEDVDNIVKWINDVTRTSMVEATKLFTSHITEHWDGIKLQRTNKVHKRIDAVTNTAIDNINGAMDAAIAKFNQKTNEMMATSMQTVANEIAQMHKLRNDMETKRQETEFKVTQIYNTSMERYKTLMKNQRDEHASFVDKCMEEMEQKYSDLEYRHGMTVQRWKQEIISTIKKEMKETPISTTYSVDSADTAVQGIKNHVMGLDDVDIEEIIHTPDKVPSAQRSVLGNKANNRNQRFTPTKDDTEEHTRPLDIPIGSTVIVHMVTDIHLIILEKFIKQGTEYLVGYNHNNTRLTVRADTVKKVLYRPPQHTVQGQRMNQPSPHALFPNAIPDTHEHNNETRYDAEHYEEDEKRNHEATMENTVPTWNHRRPLLGAHQFHLHGEEKPRSIDSHFINKYAKDWKLRLESPDENPEWFYKDVKRCVAGYNILLLRYHDIRREQGLEAIKPSNCDNYAAAKDSMSKALYAMFYNNRATIFENNEWHQQLLLHYDEAEDGLAFLKEVIRPHHPALKPRAESGGTTDQPKLSDHGSLFEFAKAYRQWINDESHSNRLYSHIENAANFLHQIKDLEAYKTPARWLSQEIEEAEIGLKTLSTSCHLDSIALTLFNKIPDKHKAAASNSNTFTINKMTKTQEQERRKAKDPTAICSLCGQVGHDAMNGDGCDVYAQALLIEKARKTMQPSDDKDIVKKYKLHNKRRQKLSIQKRNQLRKTLRKVHLSETEDDFQAIKKLTLHKFKEDHPELDLNDPFAIGEDAIQYENLDEDESESE